MNPVEAKIQQLRQSQIAQGGIPSSLKSSYPDDLLIGNLVDHGQPLWSASQVRLNPQARLHALMFYLDCEAALQGDKAAKQKVDFICSQWQAMRKEELLSDDPNKMHLDRINPADLL